MFRAIKNGLASLKEERNELAANAVAFHGFEANRELHHSYATFVIDKLRYYPEYDASPIDSHSPANLPKYRGMLAVVNARDTPATLTLAELQPLAAAEAVGD